MMLNVLLTAELGRRNTYRDPGQHCTISAGLSAKLQICFYGVASCRQLLAYVNAIAVFFYTFSAKQSNAMSLVIIVTETCSVFKESISRDEI